MSGFRAIAAAALVAGLAAAALGLRQFMTASAQDRLQPGEAVDISRLRSPLPRPSFLACPPGYCAAREAAPSPIFAVAVPQLREAWRRVIGAEPRTVEVAKDPQSGRLAYVTHTTVLGFPDIVTIEFAAFGPEGCGIAIFSRSRYGRSDFGTNRRRVERWLSLLRQREPVR